jgi:hypothetical protein
MIKKYTILSIFVFTYLLGFSLNEKKFDLFEQRSFYKPFVAEISSTLSNVSIGAVGIKKPSGDEINTAMTEVHLGADIPLMLDKGDKLKWGLSIPVSMHMLWATFEPTTAPIVNTDYRFGLSFMELFQES